MAEELEDICLACGKKALKEQGRQQAVFVFYWTGIFAKDVKRLMPNIDVAKVISCNWVCRACARSYKSHEDKDKQLYDGTAGFVDAFKSKQPQVI